MNVIQMCPVAIVIYDREGQVLLWNDEAETLSVLPSFEISPEERDRLIKCYDLDGTPIPSSELPSKVAVRQGYDERDMIVSSMGHSEKFRVRARALYDNNGKLQGSVLVWNRLNDVREKPQLCPPNGT